MSSNPSSPSWQHSATAAPPVRPSAPSWRQGGSTPRVSWLPTRRLALGLTWMSFLGCCAALVWVSTWISPPQDVALVLLGASYEDNMVFPPNSAGQTVLRELAQPSFSSG